MSRSSTTTDTCEAPLAPGAGDSLVSRRLPRHRPPTHPGEMLVEEFLDPLHIPASEFAMRLGVPASELRGVIGRERAVTPDLALRLARVLGMSADFWLGLQQDWDLWHALRSEGAKQIALLQPLGKAA